MTKVATRVPRSKGIAETYIHVKDVPIGLSKEKVLRYLEQHAHIWAEQEFKKSVTVKTRVEEGSLVIWVLVGGATLYGFVAGYGSFRSGIDYLVSDAKTFSDRVIEKFKKDEGVPESAVFRAERRLGIPGKIQRFLKSLDVLNSQDIGHNARETEIAILRKEFLAILELLEDNRDRVLFMEQVPEGFSCYPDAPLPEPIRGALSLDMIRNEENQDT